MSDIIKAYQDAEQTIFDHVGYVEDWRRLPLEISTGRYWAVDDNEDSWCRSAKSKDDLEKWLKTDDFGDMEVYEDEIYTQRHLRRWVYRGPEFTMVCVDTHCDGNQFLRIFRNDMEVKVPSAKRGIR